MDISKVKRFAVEQGMEGDNSVIVIVDRATKGLEVPDFLTDPMIALQFGYNAAQPIPDLWVDDQGIMGTLAFGEVESLVKVPWDAVCFIHDGNPANAVVFPSSGRPSPSVDNQEPPPKPERHLKLVPPVTEEAA